MDASFLPLDAWRRVTLQRDAMRAGTSHYPYTSSSHDLLSGCKDKLFSLIFQTFGLFFADFSLQRLYLQIIFVLLQQVSANRRKRRKLRRSL